MRPQSIRRAMRSGSQAPHRTGERRGRIVTLPEQAVHVAQTWATLHCRLHGRGRGARLICHGRLRPSAITREYDVRVHYTLGQPPVALVDRPSLIGRDDQALIPHTYAATDELPLRPCLYYPPDGDWGPDRSLAITIIPWLIQWLLHYEAWLATGVWSGGGVDHGTPAETTAQQEAVVTSTSKGAA